MKKSRLFINPKVIATLFIISLPLLAFSQTLISIDQLSGSSENYVRGMFTGNNGYTAVCGDYRTDLTAGQGVDEATVNSTGITSGYVGSYDENGDLQFLLGLACSKIR